MILLATFKLIYIEEVLHSLFFFLVKKGRVSLTPLKQDY